MLKNLKEKVKIFIEYYFLWLIIIIVFGLSIWLLCLGLPNVYKANSHDKQLSKEYTIDEEKLLDTLNEANKQIEKRSVIVGSITLTNSEIFKNDKVDINKQANTELEKNSVVIGTLTLTTPGLFKEDKWDIRQKSNKIEGLNKKLGNNGVFGDSAGLVTAAFAGLAFFGFLVSFIFQQKELKARNKDLNKQQFESTFFNMLKTQENIISNLNLKKNDLELDFSIPGIRYKEKEKNVVSRQVFDEIFKYFNINIDDNYKNNLKNIETKDIAKENYSILYEKEIKECLSKKVCKDISDSYWNSNNIRVLSNYFTFMYRIIKFIDENTYFTSKEKSEYVDILRSTLSTYELLMLFYNALGHNKMRKFIIDYEIFNNISYDLLKGNIYLYKLYVSKNKNGELISAYGDRLKEIEERAHNIYDTAMKNCIKENCSHKK